MQNTFQPDLVAAQLDRIVSGPPLSSSPSLCRLLRFVVEETLAGRTGSLKEYSLGVVVFERGDEFDPRMDPIVRVQARNLRVRLAQYYAGPGADDLVVIDLPKRTYVPVFRCRIEEQTQAAPAQPAEPPVPAVEAAAEPSVERQLELPAELVVLASEPVDGKQFAARAPTGRIWPRPRWAMIAAVAVLALLGITAFWRFRPAETARLRPAETARKAIHEPDPTALDLYIRGRYLMDRQTEQSFHDSIDSFNRAVARDPQFAPAYAGLADAYNVLAQFGYISPKEGMEQARSAAQRALDIDPGLAEGHVSLTAIIEAYDWKWAAAEREYRRALELNPSLPEAHLWYGMFLRDQGRLQEALSELRRAAQLDPFSVFSSLNLAHAYMLAGNVSGAEEQARHAADIAPGTATAEVLLSNIYRAQGRAAEADAALSRARQFSAGNPHAISVLACAYGRHGQRDESVRLFHQLELLAKQRYVSPFDMGSVSLVLGDDQRALTLLEEAYRQRSSGLIFLRDAKFASSHRLPGFHSLVQKMHFAG